MRYQPPEGFAGVFREDADAAAVYSEAAGVQQIMPRAVAVPVDGEDVATLVKWASAGSIPLIPRGSGSSMAGGAIGDGVIVDLSGLDAIGDVDRGRRVIRCGAGAIRNDVDAKAREYGLQFPVDPSSGAFCTVGGMASTNAAGSHTLKYGSMRPWVEALDCVFADGSTAELRRGVAPPDIPALRAFQSLVPALREFEHRRAASIPAVRKNSSGYALTAFLESGDLVDLIVGSEGTLVLIVGLELRLAAALPNTASLLGAFESLDAAVIAASLARDAGASACEAIDRTFLDVARQGGASVPVPAGAETILLVEVEGASADECAAQARAIEARFRGAGATSVTLALDPETEHSMWELRHAASPVLNRLDPNLKSMQLVEDGCVPPAKLGEYVSGVRAALDRQQLRGVIFGHAGDAHMHVNALVDVRHVDWREKTEALLAEVTRLTGHLGGTLSGEHGDGRLRTPLLSATWQPDVLERFRLLKESFDPVGILNPGVKVALPDARALDLVKYDPALPSIGAAARSVLDRVERNREYAHSRLEMLERA